MSHRRTDGHDPAALQRTLAAVRQTGALVPRGGYRFTSFEEADAWMTRMMARTHVSRSSMISSASTRAARAMAVSGPPPRGRP